MARQSRISRKTGLTPGSLVFIGERKQVEEKNYLFENKKGEITQEKLNISTLDKRIDPEAYSWYKVVGLHDIEFIKRLQSRFNLHSLIVEDVLNTEIRPKYEEFNGGFLLSIKHLYYSEDKKRSFSENISFIVLENTIISFQERSSGLYTPIMERMIDGIASVNSRGFDYLFYRLLDIVIDEYFVVLDRINERIEELEDRVINNLDESQKNEIQALRREIIERKIEINPVKEALLKLSNDPPALIQENTLKYLKDVQEHIVQIKDSIDYSREAVSGVMELYQVGMGNKMNEVMQTLTYIATIFIPITFVAGLYGMNFKNMPELEWEHGYYIALSIMLLIAIGMLYYFKRKKWF